MPDSAPILTANTPPPEGYYQNNCRTLVAFVLAQHGEILKPKVFNSLTNYLNASDGAQRLFARLLTRKGPLFRVDSLSYSEIDNITDAISELEYLQLVSYNPNFAADSILGLLKKAELVDLGANIPGIKKLKKGEILTEFSARFPDAALRQRASKCINWIGITHPEAWEMARVLYFGESVQDWSAFVLRDLGHIRYEKINLTQQTTRNLDESVLTRRYSTLSYRLIDHPDIAESLINELDQPWISRFAQRRKEKTLLRIAQWQEKQGNLTQAMATYSKVSMHPARERRVRILHKQNELTLLDALLREIEDQPIAEEEAQFAQRFGKRQAGFQPKTDTIEIGHVDKKVELQCLALLLEQHLTHQESGSKPPHQQIDYETVQHRKLPIDHADTQLAGTSSAYPWGAHVENSLIRSLTGLIYWPVIFAPLDQAFTNPFQTGPNDLYMEDFVAARTQLIDELEGALQDDNALEDHLRNISKNKFGLANSLVNWSLIDGLGIDAISAALPSAHIRKLCHFLIRNLRLRRSGMPDLLVAYGPNSYELVEVKGPNDQLQPGQRVWLKKMAELEIPGRVVKLKLVKSN